ncbi:hypothetical protein BCR42DRAFT_429677 [Absidia repens]|uniref:Heterokaryon incompatibility domain-containing protein n=1 Tax=Absidia repens TaxID=90262 RepID=A0A1X2HRL3_9FUNG|nr:hypothetical protein BCR42DRAFT_429677 [Absidia repens]
MTNDDPKEQLCKASTPEQRQQRPFQVVLVDIKKAAKEKMIHCVKRPLEEKDLEFVALSYRWGELHETLIETQVGYTASITSFALNDFYQLCHMMTLELDMKHIQYVWVDAICVDQQHEGRRKATIYQMSNIYDRATYILAVPDLHVTHLKSVCVKNDETIEGSNQYSNDIYHLIHGNVDALAAVEETFLNHIQVPNDPPALRQLLLRYTDHFSFSFMNCQDHHPFYCPVGALDHICETTQAQHRQHYHHHQQHWKAWLKGTSKNTIEELHHCYEPICPLNMFLGLNPSATKNELGQFDNANWKSKVIQRSTTIRQSMEFLTDLVKDWSSRVWVISEFNIAKKKNNLKYWFTQLALASQDNSTTYDGDDDDVKKVPFTFFKFDFVDDPYFSKLAAMIYANQAKVMRTRSTTTNPVYMRFHYTMTRQLNQQTFLEIILGSKASKNEDRFYSTLPLSEYANKKTEVSHWKISSMVSVKLKLYDIMNNMDKLCLLFWSVQKDAIKHGVLPTFVTSTLSLEFKMERLRHTLSNFGSNFDLDDPSIIILCHDQHTNNNNINNSQENDDDDDENDGGDGQPCYYSLRLKPKEFYVVTRDRTCPDTSNDLFMTSLPLCQRVGIHPASTDTLDIVLISPFSSEESSWNVIHDSRLHGMCCLVLVGSFAQNKWIIPCQDVDHYTHYDDDDLKLYTNEGENHQYIHDFNIY